MSESLHSEYLYARTHIFIYLLFHSKFIILILKICKYITCITLHVVHFNIHTLYVYILISFF